MTIEEKFNIIHIDNNRYYKIDMNEFLILDNTVPYYFEFENIKIYKNSWVRLTEEIMIHIDRINPKPIEELLKYKYKWSDQEVFSRERKTNFTEFKGIYLNTNHSGTRAFMNIKTLLSKYNIDLSKCTLIIKKHPRAENQEVKNYYKEITINEFSNYLILRFNSIKKVESTIRNIEKINNILEKINGGFDDFFLFENDYYRFTKYKEKVINKSKKIYYGKEHYIQLVEHYLNYLDSFYYNRAFYKRILKITIPDEFKDIAISETSNLFSYFNTKIISSAKLYSRICILHPELMEQLNSLNNYPDFCSLIYMLLGNLYNCKGNFIAQRGYHIQSNDELIYNYAQTLDIISITEINNYVDERQYSKLDNYSKFMSDISNNYIQVDIEKLIRKNIFKIKKTDLEQIVNELNYYLNSFGEIDSDSFLDFSSLPTLEYKWNKYLLLGIVRTFLQENFTIKYVKNQYTSLKFLIKKN